MATKVYTRSHTPSTDYTTGILAGLDRDGADYSDARATALYSALGASREDEEYVLGSLPDGRWALVGLDVEGHRFAIEIENPADELVSFDDWLRAAGHYEAIRRGESDEDVSMLRAAWSAGEDPAEYATTTVPARRYTVRYAHTSAVERFATLEEADAAIRSVFTDPYTDGWTDGARQLYWRDEESSVDDDGSRAIASITVSS